MNIERNLRLRLQFLSRVAEKECYSLNRTTERLFAEPFTLERARQLGNEDELSERVEAFAARFARLQDTLGDKFLPQLLAALGERRATALDNLDIAERLGWLPSADEWQAIRRLRNQMVHEYIEDPQILVSAIQTAQQFVPTLTGVNSKFQEVLRERGWL
jgi:hypothetical protein